MLGRIAALPSPGRPGRQPGRDLTLSSVRGYESRVLKVKNGNSGLGPFAPLTRSVGARLSRLMLTQR